MFDVGFSEILVIAGLSLVVLGPDKLPGVARKLGQWAGRARAMARQFRDQLESEADAVKVNLNTDPPPRATPQPTAAAQPEAPPAAPPPEAPASASPPPPPEFTGAPMPPQASAPPPAEPPPHG